MSISSPSILVREKLVGAARSTPIAEKWMKPAHGGALAGGEQGVGAAGVHAARRIVRAVLQDPRRN